MRLENAVRFFCISSVVMWGAWRVVANRKFK